VLPWDWRHARSADAGVAAAGMGWGCWFRVGKRNARLAEDEVRVWGREGAGRRGKADWRISGLQSSGLAVEVQRGIMSEGHGEVTQHITLNNPLYGVLCICRATSFHHHLDQ